MISRIQNVATRPSPTDRKRAFHGSGVGCQSVGQVLDGCLEAVGNAVLGELVADQRELFEIGGDLG